MKAKRKGDPFNMMPLDGSFPWQFFTLMILIGAPTVFMLLVIVFGL
ncbi:MAG: hypothetical protein AAGI44_00060 [Pseudomonadota bacterium]